MDRCWEMSHISPTQEVPTLFCNSSEQRKQNKRDVYVMHEQHNWDLILLSYGRAQHCRWNLTTESFIKGFCECFITRQLEASHDTPSSLINNSVYAFLIPPMNVQQSVLSHLTVLTSYRLWLHQIGGQTLIQTHIRDVPCLSMARGETVT